MVNILVVDDEQSIRVSVREFLRDAKYEVAVAEDAEKAMEMLSAEHFDIVLADIILPRKTGVSLLKAIKQTSPDVQVILMTGEPTVETAAEAVRAGAFDYLAKPIGKQNLLRSVAMAAKLRAVDDERRQLAEQNLHYQKNLKKLVEERTAELDESKKQYVELYNSAPIAYFSVGPDGCIKMCNHTAGELLGFSTEELVGRPVLDLYADTKHGKEKSVHIFERFLTGDRVHDEEMQMQKADGESLWVSLTVNAVRDDQDRVLESRSMVVDITVRKQAEEALRESERNLISAQKTANFGHYVLDIESGEWTSSAGLDRIFGTDENYKRDIAGWVQLVRPDHRETMLDYLQDDVLTQHKVFDKEYVIVDIQTGQEKWVHGIGNLKLDKDNSPIEMFGTIQDITERIEVEAETARLGTVVEQASTTIYITDLDGNIVYANPYSETSTGYNVSELLSQNPRILKSGSQDVAFYEELWECISSGRTWNGTLVNKRKNGDIYHEDATIFPITNLDGKIINYAAVKRDISENVRINKDRERLLDRIQEQARFERETQRHIQQQEQLVAVGQLASGIAHDFNNFMGVILLYASMELKNSDISPESQKRLGVISQQAKRATELTQQILDFARRSVLERRPMDLKPFLKEVIKLLEHTIEESVSLELNYGTDEYVVKADPTRMQQVIMNLTVNARDSMPDGGKLYFELDMLKVESGKKPPLPDMDVGKWVRIDVVDTGSGIPSDKLEHIFEPFFTTRAKGVGTGLGLSQVYGIVKQHEGHIKVATEVGTGTTISIYLPALSNVQNEATLQQTQTLVQGQGETILVVEDEAALRNALTDTLEMLNYRVLAVANGREALDTMELHAEEVSLVLSDLVMPEMGGQEMFRELIERGLTMPVVMLSGHALRNELEHLKKQGLAGWMLKPPNMEQLSQLLAGVLKGESD